jgi:hypothetical protein
MNPPRLRLKHPSGWFAAGREMANALAVLSDAAFKLFVWICLHAERSRGALAVRPAEIARALHKADAEITIALEELLFQGVCRRTVTEAIEITDCFWPYERITADGAEEPRTYLERVKRVFLERACVESAFTAADEKLALQLHDRGVPIQTVERAILLGSLRKYISLVNRRGGTPITSLHYFTLLFEEVQSEKISKDYWGYIAMKVRTVERQWSQSTKETK